jgi:hypothetical protein
LAHPENPENLEVISKAKNYRGMEKLGYPVPVPLRFIQYRKNIKAVLRIFRMFQLICNRLYQVI